MATNRGVAPPDSTTPVGQLRVLLGDVIYTPLTPPETGFGNYTNFSDDQLNSYLTEGANSVSRAAGYAYLGLAASFGGDEQWQSDDLNVKETQGSFYFKLAQYYFGLADSTDKTTSQDYFAIVPTKLLPEFSPWPEAAQRTYVM